MTAQLFCRLTFNENYSIFWQDEVQSAHWHKNQITVFTAALWQSVGCILAVVVSGNHSHSRDCVVFLQHLVKLLLNENIYNSITYIQVANLKTST